jgi:hypothetical protein
MTRPETIESGNKGLTKWRDLGAISARSRLDLG